MANAKNNHPTDAEVAILSVLWDKGPCTVRQVHEAVGRVRPTVYTSTLKLMQLMAAKGLVVRDESARTHVYRAAAPQKQTQQRLVNDLLERAFGGSAEQLVMRALSAKKVPPKELAKIREILDKLERG
jgi:predicted transcriptional regulator